MDDEGRMSQLPEHVLEQIVSHLPQEDAVRTCVLSKSWRHLGPTLPKIEFHESSYPEKKQQQLFVKNNLQRYLDQKLSIREIKLVMSESESESDYGFRLNKFSCRLLNKWIPIAIMNMGVKTLNLTAQNFSLPPIVFESKVLEELYLKGCKVNQINNNVNLHTLKRLSLRFVYIEDQTLEKILSSCPSIEHLVLDLCLGLNTTKVNKARNLKHFYYRMCTDRIGRVEIDDDASASLETIHIEGGSVKPLSHLHNDNNYYFPRLKSLKLWRVHLTTELLNNLSLSNNFPCLEELQLHYCSGFTEFKLSHRSIKRLIIRINDRPIMAAIDAANMLYFEVESKYLPSISFVTTNSRECKSRVDVWPCLDSSVYDLARSRKLHEFHEFLKALSQSRIFFNTSCLPLTNYEGGSCEPVVVELLWLRADFCSCGILEWLNCLFCTFRPRYIDLFLSATSSQERYEVAESIWKALVRKGETRQSLWKQDLEESSIQVFDKNTKEWRSVQVCELPKNERIRFRLKWKSDLS